MRCGVSALAFAVAAALCAVALGASRPGPRPRKAAPSRPADGKPVVNAAGEIALSGRVLDALNGYTITVLGGDNIPHVVCLLGVDAPPKWEDWGRKAKNRLEEMLAGQTVRLAWSRKNEVGYPLCRVTWNRQDASLQMLREGLGWCCTQVETPKSYMAAEAAAKKARRGFWSDDALVAPSEGDRHPSPPAVDATTQATPKAKKKVL